jgi:hypothetical protein
MLRLLLTLLAVLSPMICEYGFQCNAMYGSNRVRFPSGPARTTSI